MPDKHIIEISGDAQAASPGPLVTDERDEDDNELLSVGERLPYNEYTTIDWMHELVSSPQLPLSNSLTASLSRSRILLVIGTSPQRAECSNRCMGG